MRTWGQWAAGWAITVALVLAVVVFGTALRVWLTGGCP